MRNHGANCVARYVAIRAEGTARGRLTCILQTSRSGFCYEYLIDVIASDALFCADYAELSADYFGLIMGLAEFLPVSCA